MGWESWNEAITFFLFCFFLWEKCFLCVWMLFFFFTLLLLPFFLYEILSLFIEKIICIFPFNCLVPKQTWWPSNPKITLVLHFFSLHFDPFVHIIFIFDVSYFFIFLYFLKKQFQCWLNKKNRSIILKWAR